MKNIEQKDRELFDLIAIDYAKKDVVPSSSHARKYQLMSAIGGVLKDVGSTGTIVDIACGVGAPAKYLSQHYSKYTGVDYSSELINQARIFNYGNDRVTFINKNIKDITVGDIGGSADIILAVGALHHMTDLNQVVLYLRTVAKPNGWLVAIEPSGSNPIVQLLRKLRTKVDTKYSVDQRYFSKKELILLLKSAGFRDIIITGQGFFSPPFAQVIMRPQWLFYPLSRFFTLIDKFLDTHLSKSFKFLSWNYVIQARF